MMLEKNILRNRLKKSIHYVFFFTWKLRHQNVSSFFFLDNLGWEAGSTIQHTTYNTLKRENVIFIFQQKQVPLHFLLEKNDEKTNVTSQTFFFKPIENSILKC